MKIANRQLLELINQASNIGDYQIRIRRGVLEVFNEYVSIGTGIRLGIPWEFVIENQGVFQTHVKTLQPEGESEIICNSDGVILNNFIFPNSLILKGNKII